MKKLMKRAPWYFPAHFAVTEMRMPRWGGAGESESYARSIAKRIGGNQGAVIYARIAIHMSRFYGAGTLFGPEKFDYEKIMASLRDVLRQYRDDPYTLQELMMFAYLRKDRPTAAEYLKRIKELDIPGFRGTWSEEQFARARAWVEKRVNAAAKAESRK